MHSGKIIKQVHIPQIGVAIQLKNGDVIVQYPDKSKLHVQLSTSNISYSDSVGRSTQYLQGDVIPHDIRLKLGHMPKVFEALKHSS